MAKTNYYSEEQMIDFSGDVFAKGIDMKGDAEEHLKTIKPSLILDPDQSAEECLAQNECDNYGRQDQIIKAMHIFALAQKSREAIQFAIFINNNCDTKNSRITHWVDFSGNLIAKSVEELYELFL